MNRLSELGSTLAELAGVLRVLPGVERARRAEGPRPLLLRLRRHGERARRRDEAGRRCLRRAIGLVDRWLTGGANCYRRALLELTLDRGAAQAPLELGLRLDGNNLVGHAWLKGTEPANDYDLTIQV